MKYRVVKVSNNLAARPEMRADTEEFPKLVDYVEDEKEVFIVDEMGRFWPASEFFFMVNLKEFVAAEIGHEVLSLPELIKELETELARLKAENERLKD